MNIVGWNTRRSRVFVLTQPYNVKKTPTASQLAEFFVASEEAYLYKGNKGKGFVKSVVHLFTNE